MTLPSADDTERSEVPALHQAVGPHGRRWHVDAGAEGDPIEGPDAGAPGMRGPVAAPRLARHLVTLSDGHQVGVAVSGRGLPLVVVHGFSAEGFLYAQTLSRLVSMGFKVVAIDTAGHGGTQGLPYGGANLEHYSRLLARAIDELGIRRAMLAGHSMGGRLVTQYAASEPDRAIAVLLLDAIVGDTWDQMVNLFRLAPPLLGGVFVLLVADTVSTVPVFGNPRQAAKLGRLLIPTLVDRVRRPWRLIGPGVSILRSRGSRWMLQRIGQEEIPLYAIHGDRDFAVPLSTAASAARHARGELVVVQGGSHSWLLKDPETLPAIVAELLHGRLGDAYRDALKSAGLDPDVATFDDIEAALYEPGAPVLELTPAFEFRQLGAHHHAPRYRWRTSTPNSTQ